MVSERERSVAKFISRFLPSNTLARIGYPPDRSGLVFPDNKSVIEDIKSKYGENSELAEIYSANKKYLIHKWHHYFHIYENYFSKFRSKSNLRLLEIGVSKGGSLQLWRKYFGEEATIFGIDVDPDCRKYNGLSGQVRIGSQDDNLFLKSVVEEMGGVDIIIDDGSHIMSHINASLDFLFPYLSNGGIYLVEDLHTCYWATFEGGYRSRKSFFETIMVLIDDMHRWYHLHSLKKPSISKNCTGIHIHDSIVVLEKNKTYMPQHSFIS